jgi:hypothetical protein
MVLGAMLTAADLTAADLNTCRKFQWPVQSLLACLDLDSAAIMYDQHTNPDEDKL